MMAHAPAPAITLAHTDPQQASICQPPGSRLFIVCGRAVEGAWRAPIGVAGRLLLARPR
jgi:hypothetical protein